MYAHTSMHAVDLCSQHATVARFTAAVLPTQPSYTLPPVSHLNLYSRWVYCTYKLMVDPRRLELTGLRIILVCCIILVFLVVTDIVWIRNITTAK